MGALVPVLLVLLLIQLPGNVPGKAAEDGSSASSSAWVPATSLGGEGLASDPTLAFGQ